MSAALPGAGESRPGRGSERGRGGTQSIRAANHIPAATTGKDAGKKVRILTSVTARAFERTPLLTPTRPVHRRESAAPQLGVDLQPARLRRLTDALRTAHFDAHDATARSCAFFTPIDLRDRR